MSSGYRGPHGASTTTEDDAAIARLLAQDMGSGQQQHHETPSTFESDTELAQRMSMEQNAAQSTFESDAELARRLAGEEEAPSYNDWGGDLGSNARNGRGGGGLGRALSGMISAAPGARRPRPPPTTTSASTNQNFTVLNCPGNHGLEMFEVSPAQRVRCNSCKSSVRSGKRLYSCIECDYDVCGDCYERGGPPRQSAMPQSSFAAPRSFARPSNSSTPPSSSDVPHDHMCVVPCIIGDGACVEMMVDTGAQSSVITLQLAKELNLDNRLDRRHRGVAAGVGRAAIVGRIRNVICTMGNVEFDMDFMVLDIPDKMLLLGLDLMRKFKCIVDLERQRLVFGGHDGVDVPFLPPEQQHIPAYMREANNCPMM